jgi:hypothetical protein
MKKHGFDIAEEMLEHYNEAMAEKPRQHERAITILMNMAKYVYPTLKSVEQVEATTLDGLSPEQKLEAIKEYVKALEASVNAK